MKPALWWILPWLFTVALSQAATPARAAEIEKKFGITFLDTHRGKVRSGGPVVDGWEFTEDVQLTIRVIGFIVPVNATDRQVQMCLNAAEFCAGWHQTFWDELVKRAKEKAKEASEPSI